MSAAFSIACLQRPLAILATLGFAWLIPGNMFDLFAISILFAHYLAAIRFHPWGKIRASGALPSHLVLIFLLAGAAQLMFQTGLPGIVFFFGIHFVLTELYEGREKDPVRLLLPRAVYYASVYLFFMKFNLGLEDFGEHIFLITVASLLFLLFSIRSWPRAAAEISLMLPLLFVFHQPMRFSYILAYHVFLWWMIPLVRGSAYIPRKIIIESAVATAGFLVVVYGTYLWRDSFFWFWHREVARFGYLHISLTFMMSSLNPAFLRNGFSRAHGILRNVI